MVRNCAVGAWGRHAAPEIPFCGPRVAAKPPHVAHKKRILEGHPEGTRPSKPPLRMPTTQVMFLIAIQVSSEQSHYTHLRPIPRCCRPQNLSIAMPLAR